MIYQEGHNPATIRFIMDKVPQKLSLATSTLGAAYSEVISNRRYQFNRMLSQGILLLSPDLKLVKRAAHARYESTPIGRSPKTILHALGLNDIFFDYVLSLVVPSCSRCSCKATQPLSTDYIELPSKGVLALVPVDDSTAEGFSLKERCDWLGSERIVVDNRLIRLDEYQESEERSGGAPVLCVITGGDRKRLTSEVDSWFRRGGADLQLLNFQSRDAEGQEIARLCSSWRCPQCDLSLRKITMRELLEARKCEICGGVGWIDDTSGRLIACLGCGGLGKDAQLNTQLFNETPLSAVLTLSFSELFSMISGIETPLKRAISLVNQFGFGDYPLGSAVCSLSEGELSLLSVLCGELSGFGGFVYGLDGALGDFEAVRAKHDLVAARTVVLKPLSDDIASTSRFPTLARTGGCDAVISLCDIRYGCLDIPHITFRLGELSAVLAPVGSGATTLLSVIAERFTKRSKIPYQGNFAKVLKRCSVISSLVDDEVLVIESLGLQRVFAKEIARTRGAQETSILEGDLLLPRGRYRCTECLADKGFTGSCELCLGARYDWRVAGLLVGGREVAQIMTQPLGNLLSCPFSHIGLERFLGEFVRIMPQRLSERLNLGTMLTELSIPDRRFIRVVGGLLRVLTYLDVGSSNSRVGTLKTSGSGSDLNSELVLVDGPRVMQRQEAEVVYGLVSQLAARGATVIFASIPEQIESAAGSIIKLVEKHGVTWRNRIGEQYLDTRYSLCLTNHQI
jgi:hypothetical protein